MYRVVIRKSLRYADGTTALEESQEEVNHERHALNLAGKIARTEVVEWVEIEELKGHFKARAARARDGTVHESLQSPRHSIQRNTRFQLGRKKRVVRLVLICLLVFGALTHMASRAASEDLTFGAGILAFMLVLLAVIWLYSSKGRSPSRPGKTLRKQRGTDQYDMTGRKLR